MVQKYKLIAILANKPLTSYIDMKVFYKIFVTFLAVGTLMVSCAKKSDIVNLQEQIDAIKSNQIQPITSQIAAIQASLDKLQSADSELQGYISMLMTEADRLDRVDKDLADAISKLREEVKDDISSAESDALKQLEAFKAYVESELAILKDSIEKLQKKDEELQSRVEELKTYIDSELKETKDWMNATFATLDQYNTTAVIVAGIQSQIKSINDEMAGIKTSLDDFRTEINKALDELETDLKAEIKQAADAAAKALEDATDEITKAYTAAIAGAINALESSIKLWVNEQLTAYYTAAQIDSRLEALQTALEATMQAQNESLRRLITDLESSVNAKIADNKALIDGLLADLAGMDSEISDLATIVTKNSENIAANADKISENTAKILENASDIAAAEALIDANSALIENNKTAIAANASAISALQDRARTADDAIAKNAADIATNAAAIAKNAADINMLTGNLAQYAFYIDRNTADILSIKKDIEDLQMALADQKTEITAAYTQAIAEAITANNGILDAKLKDEIKTINDLVQIVKLHADNAEQLALILKQEVQEIKDGLKSLSSIAYIPKYADGIERVEYEVSGYKFTKKGDLTLRFDVYPASSAQTIADSYASTLSARVVYTIPTKANAGDFTELQITDAAASGGILTVTISSSELDFDFLVGNLKASLVLKVTTGYNNLQSTYIPLVASGENLSYAQYVLGSFDTDRDEDLSDAELSAVANLDLTRCPDINTLDLTVFPNLTKVNCPSLDWLRKLAPTYDITTTFLSADGRSRLYPEDDILIDGTVWQTKNVGAGLFVEMGTEARFEVARDSSCPEGYRLPTRDEFEALSRNHMLFHAPLYYDGFRFSGSRVLTDELRVPSIFLPFSRHGELRYGTYYWIYSTNIPATDIPTFYLDDMPPDLRTPSGWFREHTYYSSERTGIRCVKD